MNKCQLITAEEHRRTPLLLALCGLLALSQPLLAQDKAADSKSNNDNETIAETVSTLDSTAPVSGVEGIDAVAYFSDSPDHFTQEKGDALYRTTCQACHMADGKGAEGAGAYPPLAGNPKLLSRHYIVSVLLTGYHGMPRFGDQMADEQIAAVSNFVRSAFGNEFKDEITAEDVAELRPPESLQAHGGGH